MTSWQPIETAPKDGTPVLLFEEFQDEIIIARYIRGVWVEACENLDIQGDATYSSYVEPYGKLFWMPLPTPPKETERVMG